MTLGMPVSFGIWYFLIMKTSINHRMVLLTTSFLLFTHWLPVMIPTNGTGSVHALAVNCDAIARAANGFHLSAMDEKGKFY